MVALLNANFQLRDIYRCLIYLYLKNTPEMWDEMHFIGPGNLNVEFKLAEGN